MLGEIGTLAWCRRTNGILGRGERARFVAAVVLSTARTGPRLAGARLGLRGGGPDPSALTPPDSALARAVVEACADLPPMVVEHGYRCHLFARALGIAEGLECDEELLFAATMLHDYAFDAIDTLDDRCFAYAGAQSALDVLASAGLGVAEREAVADAICLHVNPEVGRERGALQHLCHDGVLADVLGARAWELDGAGVERVQDRYPRQGFTVPAEAKLRTHARRVAGCRTAALFTAGFGAALKTGAYRARDMREARAAG